MPEPLQQKNSIYKNIASIHGSIEVLIHMRLHSKQFWALKTLGNHNFNGNVLHNLTGGSLETCQLTILSVCSQ